MRSFRNWTAVAAAASALSVYAQAPMEYGNWHITTQSTTNGKADPAQVQDECLGKELEDLGAYFAPRLEGVKAQCKKAPLRKSGERIAYKMRCTGSTFTMDVESDVKVENPRRFTATMKLDTRTRKERAVVVAGIEGRHTGPCRQP